MREVSLTPWQTRFLQLVEAGSDFKVTGGVGCGRGLVYSVAAEQFCAPGMRADGTSGVLVVAPSGARYEELKKTLRALGTPLVSAVTRETARIEYLAEESMAISSASWSPRYTLVVVESDGRAPHETVLSSVPTGAITALVEADREVPSFDWTGVPVGDWNSVSVSEAVSRAIRPHIISRDLCSDWGDRADVWSSTRGRDGDSFSGGPWRVAVVVPRSCGVSARDVSDGVRGTLGLALGSREHPLRVLDALDTDLVMGDLEAGRTVNVTPTPDLLVHPYTMLVVVGGDAASCQGTAERSRGAIAPGGAIHVIAPDSPGSS
jgi:hypothetical protein